MLSLDCHDIPLVSMEVLALDFQCSPQPSSPDPFSFQHSPHPPPFTHTSTGMLSLDCHDIPLVSMEVLALDFKCSPQLSLPDPFSFQHPFPLLSSPS